MSNSWDNPVVHREAGGIPLLHGPITAEEALQKAREQQRKAKEASDLAFQERQVQAVEAANRIAARNSWLTGLAATVAAFALAATVYQAKMTRKSWNTAQDTLGQMKADSQASSEQFLVQLGHFDAGLGRSDMLAKHAGDQVDAAKEAANATTRAAEIAATTLKVSQRPWVSAQAYTVNNTQYTSWFSIDGTVTFVNTGNSVASNGSSHAWIMPNDGAHLKAHWNEPCQFELANRKTIASGDSNPWPLGFLLTPGGQSHARIDASGVGIPVNGNSGYPNVVSQDKVKWGAYYVIGCTLYEDQFGTTHHFQWCFQPKRNGSLPESPLVLEPCEAFEYTD